ncbi:MAG: hypothetical protein LBQ12_14160 [Deltaproteobacteria bacterium]|jgi:hypothetical protein|nr:hypothetical protein [Deltaproteobacteria bacterium]
MAQGYVIPHPIFDSNSLPGEQASAPFCLTQGWMAEFIAVNFADHPVRPDLGKPTVYQAACLRKILYKNFEMPDTDGAPCGPLPDVAGRKAEILTEIPVIAGGCPWSISACDNYRLLDLPGVYRLVLNDPDAAGTVSVYMLAHPRSEWPSRPSRLYFGE